MRIRYILGRAGSGKTHRVLDEIEYRLKEKNNNKLILLVPEQFTLQAEADLIFKKNLEGIMRVEVLSFQRLGYKILNETGGIKKTAINELGKIMVLRKLFEENSKSLTVFNKASRKDGFLSSFCQLITELKKDDIPIETIEEKAEAITQDSMLKRKLKDISLIYSKFNEYIEGKYTDDEDKMKLVIEKLDNSTYFDDAEIWVDGFNSFSALEYKILEKLMIKSRKLNIALTLDIKSIDDISVFKPTSNTYEKLRDMAQRNGIEERKTILDINTEYKNQEIWHLEKELFAYPYKKYEKNTERVKVFYSLNQYTEIENVASHIVSLVRDKNYRWRDISVVCNIIDSYTSTIKRVFSEYGIPYFIDDKRSIMNNPIVKFIISGLEIVSRNFRYEDVFKFIKTGFSDLERDECEELENYVLRFGIMGDKWLKDFEYGDDKLELERINSIRSKFTEYISAFKKRVKNKTRIEDITKYLFEFLTDMNIEKKLNNLIEAQKEKGYLDLVNENTQIWNILMEVLDQLVEILGDKKVTIGEYVKILESGLSEYEVGVIPPTMDQVLVGNLDRSRSHDIKALFVVGVNDGILPSAIEEGGLLLDEEKAEMKSLGIEISSDNETKACEEEFSVYASFIKPSDYLFISYALGDIEGKTLRPSIFIDRLKKIYSNLTIYSDIIKDKETELNLIATPVSTFKYLIENLRLALDGYEINEMWWDVYHWYYNKEEWREKIQLAIEGLYHNNQQERIDEEYSRQIYQLPFRSSISRLEKYVNCPYSHFVKYGLAPEERKIHEIKSPDIGMLFHNSIEEFSKELSLEELSWNEFDKNKSDEIVEKVLDKMIDDFQHGLLLSTNRYKYMVNRLKRISKRALWTITEHIRKGDFVPIQHEVSFGDGPNNKIPPIIIYLPNGEEIRLEGRIDRVDILEGEKESFVKIIDYKSGSKAFSLSDAYYGLQIQLLVYADAIISNGDKLIKNDIYPAGVFYFKIDDPMIQSDEEDLEIIEKEIAKKLKLDGIMLKDINIVKAIDRDIEETNNSSIIPVSINKDGSFSKNSSVLDKEELNLLIKHVKGLISEIADEILKGRIKIEPCKTDKYVSCAYCEFSTICQFETGFEDNKYRSIKKLKDEDVILKIKEESGGEE
ncbi:helicase-exonuclease AddAB subunit AddB [Proteiniborus sp. MB09-C3]|uniref:helicase-exonuclease AddAB subunit AddB n=1 Tax=Proteiniborus sp. MB09-C3 TaxID=3050072 RepID=UPI002553AF3B|nr:helicase-exonuclease AddAB subunit AddB [Proteiniborus sp. MB09-C3]WIV10639.1 helicase-exonuclease AddAB subunit AddB [Proteiniborus sp. MB09-C3]